MTSEEIAAISRELVVVAEEHGECWCGNFLVCPKCGHEIWTSGIAG